MNNSTGCCRRNLKKERGSAVLIVITLLMVMAILVVNNGRVLHLLGQQLKLIDQQQQGKFNSGTGQAKQTGQQPVPQGRITSQN